MTDGEYMMKFVCEKSRCVRPTGYLETVDMGWCVTCPERVHCLGNAVRAKCHLTHSGRQRRYETAVTFYIVDDDPTVRRILRNILEEERIGEIAGEAEDGEKALSEILLLEPDVAIVDLLLPGCDGVALVEALKKEGCRTVAVMLSQVTDKEMVGHAYQAGVRFFINKPINRMEILSVLRSVVETLSLQETIRRVRSLLSEEPVALRQRQLSVEDAVNRVLARLGIMGESGARDIIVIIQHLHQLGLRRGRERLRHLAGLYKEVRRLRFASDDTQRRAKDTPGPPASEDSNASPISFEERAIEQRVRRTIAAALQNLAALGLEHPESEVFQHYAHRFFDFLEVRNEMRFLKGETPYHGKVSVRRFLEALFIEVEDQLKTF